MASRKIGVLLVAVVCAASIALSQNTSAAVQLSLKLDKGKTYYRRVMIDQRIAQTMMGQEQAVNYDIGLGQKLEVLNVDGQGNMQIRHTYIWSRFKQSGPMGEVDYDSSQAAANTAGAEAFAALVGQSCVIRVSPKGKVLDVNGVEAMAESIQKKTGDKDVTSSASPLAFLLTRQGIQETEEGLLAVYPEEAVEIGASWTEKRTTKQGLSLITELKWTLQKREGGVATIGETASLKSDPSGPPLDAGTAKIKIDVSGTEEGTLQVDEATGLIKTSRSTQTLKGQMGVGASAEGPFNLATIPSTFTTAVTLEMSDRMWQTVQK